MKTFAGVLSDARALVVNRLGTEYKCPGLPRHNHCASKADTAIEIEHIRVEHPNAAIGNGSADRSWIVRAVDRGFATSQENYRRTQRVVRRATRDHRRQVRFVTSYD